MNSTFDPVMNSTNNPLLNSTDDTPTIRSVTDAVLFLVLSIAIAIENTLVIVVIWKDPYKELKRTSAKYLILNLAICGLLTGVPGMVLRGLICFFPSNNNLFVGVATSLEIPFCASYFTVVSLAIERLIVVSYPLISADYLTTRCLILWIILIWIATVLVVYLRMARKNVFIISTLLWNDAIEVMIMIILVSCYMRIYIIVRRSLYLNITTAEERRTEDQGLTKNARRMEMLKKMERKVLRTVFILTAIFLVCWIPIFVIKNLGPCNRSYLKCSFPENLFIALHALLDPLFYALCTAKFRRALLKIWSEVFNHNNNETFRR